LGRGTWLHIFAVINQFTVYPVVYGFFYLLSLLPWKVLYFISDGIYALVYYVIGYRRDIVMNNLSIAFPDKTEKERLQIAKGFYHNFIDTFIETIKLLSVSKKQFSKRVTTNVELLNELYPSGQSVIITAGHFFNWEFANLSMSAFCDYPFVGVYMPLSNKTFNRMIVHLRKKFGTLLVAATNFKAEYAPYLKMQHAIGLVADQNPGNPTNGYWYPFFGKLAPFVKGPERSAKGLNAAIVMVNFYKKKRGYYNIHCTLLTTTPKDYKAGEITKQLVHFVEDCVRQNPSNYLWSHRRWKHQFNEERHGHLVI
jgi:KDO2-lipid IV(A) lauroyltransferase